MDRYKLIVTDYNWGNLEIEKSTLSQAEAERQIKVELIPAQCRTEEDVIRVASQADDLLNYCTPK